MGGEFFTDFKSSNGIEISWLVQLLLNFYWFLGSTPRGVAMGAWEWGWVWVCVGCPMHTCMHTHACTCMLNMLIMLNMDASMSAAICNFYTCIHVCMCVCMCAYACACVWEHPPCPQMPLTPPHPPAPPPRAEKTQIGRITITLEPIEIIQFCLKIYDPWTLLHTYRLGLMCRWGVSYPK